MLPVVLLVAVGYFAARGKLMSEADTKDLSSLVFVLLIPVLLFRTMSTVHLVQLDFVPITSYFIAVFIFFRHSGGQGV
ncbi:MAG: AEC family transporter [Rhodoferax sp.]|nr:AEC family transporter [Rhodoferax sp.]